MTRAIKWRRLIAIASLAEILTLAVWFGLPALQGRAFPDPHFPRVIVFHQTPPGCIVDFQGNLYVAAAESAMFWICAVLVATVVVRFLRSNERPAK